MYKDHYCNFKEYKNPISKVANIIQIGEMDKNIIAAKASKGNNALLKLNFCVFARLYKGLIINATTAGLKPLNALSIHGFSWN